MPSTTDSFFGAPFIDIDEVRHSPSRHRYIHGGFEGTDTRFSLYFPPAEHYEGRFLHLLEGGLGGNEHSAQQSVLFGGIDLGFGFGAYVVETNHGHSGDMAGLNGDGTILNYRANTAAARYGRELAKEIYGEAPHHGYAFGGSGGGHRSVMALENSGDVYDGAVPFMIPPPIPANSANAARLLHHKLTAVIDAMDTGGSGNPFDGLTTAERTALAELYRLGYPRGTEYLLTIQPIHIMLMNRMRMVDPTYFTEFWTEPGYRGADEPGALADGILDERATVDRLVTAGELTGLGAQTARYLRGQPTDAVLGIVLDHTSLDVPPATKLTFTSGPATGRELFTSAMAGDVIVSLVSPADWTFGHSSPFEGVAPGDQLELSNRDFVAFCHYERYQFVPECAWFPQPVVDGRPVYPVRPRVDLGHKFAEPVHTGRFSGKMLLLQHAHDSLCWPTAAVFYDNLVRQQQGQDVDDHLRLWFIDHAHHLPPTGLTSAAGPPATSRLIDYLGCGEQALAHLIEWVEGGVDPPRNTGYRFTADRQVILAPTATERLGIQPVVQAEVNGATVAVVRPGEAVTLAMTAEMPPGAGSIVALEWDLAGTGDFEAAEASIGADGRRAHVSVRHAFAEPGVYFPAARVRSRRDGDAQAPHSVDNLAHVRVVVRS